MAASPFATPAGRARDRRCSEYRKQLSRPTAPASRGRRCQSARAPERCKRPDRPARCKCFGNGKIQRLARVNQRVLQQNRVAVAQPIGRWSGGVAQAVGEPVGFRRRRRWPARGLVKGAVPVKLPAQPGARRGGGLLLRRRRRPASCRKEPRARHAQQAQQNPNPSA